MVKLHFTRPNKENCITFLQFVPVPTKTCVESQIWPKGPSLGSLNLNTKYCTAKLDSQKLPPPKDSSGHDGRYWPGCVCSRWEWMAGLLTLGSAPDISNREWSYQLLSYLNSDQLPLQRHTRNLNFPIKSTPYTHIHTLTTLDTVGCKYSGSGQTQITPPKFRVIPADPNSGHLFALSSISGL